MSPGFVVRGPRGTRKESAIRNHSSAIVWYVAAVGLYAVFATYLYRPHFAGFARWQWLLPVNACIAGMGAYVLSRRWVMGFSGSFLAGLLYGFGPYLLGLGKFHPTAGLLAATIPWLFVPAAFLGKKRGKWVGVPLLLLPFVVVVLFFYLSAAWPQHRLFAAPLQAEMRPADLAGFVAPLVVVRRSTALIGLYHVPVAALVLGLAMMFKARRHGFLVVLVAGMLLAFCKSLLGPPAVHWLGVSPILWLSIPMTSCAVLSGIGLQGLIEAGHGDRKWILAAAIVLGVLAVVTLLLAVKYFQFIFGLADGYARLFVEAGKRYLVGAVAMAILYLMTRQNLRVHWLRWALLCVALGLDIFLGARHVVDNILR